jgi:hypothetical protein
LARSWGVQACQNQPRISNNHRNLESSGDVSNSWGRFWAPLESLNFLGRLVCLCSQLNGLYVVSFISVSSGCPPLAFWVGLGTNLGGEERGCLVCLVSLLGLFCEWSDGQAGHAWLRRVRRGALAWGGFWVVLGFPPVLNGLHVARVISVSFGCPPLAFWVGMGTSHAN